MASIRKEIVIDAPPEDVWGAVRDFGAVHRRLAPGFVVDVRLEGETRLVTFANGLVVREPLVDLDDEARRLAYAAVGGRATHYNASMQVFADGERSARLVWIIDLLPHELAGPVGAIAEQALRVAKETLERQAARG